MKKLRWYLHTVDGPIYQYDRDGYKTKVAATAAAKRKAKKCPGVTYYVYGALEGFKADPGPVNQVHP